MKKAVKAIEKSVRKAVEKSVPEEIVEQAVDEGLTRDSKAETGITKQSVKLVSAAKKISPATLASKSRTTSGSRLNLDPD
jgi:hypothetical protein